jgi:hypothetical protein
MRFGVWLVTEKGIFGTEVFEKYYIERDKLALLINGEYVDMLVHIAQKADIDRQNIDDLNESYRYAIETLGIKGISEEIMVNTFAKQIED